MQPQTADQINRPQTGQLTTATSGPMPGDPAHVKAHFKKIFGAAKEHRDRELAPPPGWWSIKGISGSLDGVIKHIEDRTDIPPYMKSFLRADLTIRCKDGFNFVYVDAHYHIENGAANFHYSAIPDKKLI